SADANGVVCAGLLFRARLPSGAEENGVEERIVRRLFRADLVLLGAIIIGGESTIVRASGGVRALRINILPVRFLRCCLFQGALLDRYLSCIDFVAEIIQPGVGILGLRRAAANHFAAASAGDAT